MLEITTCKGLHVIFENEKDEVLLPHFTAFYYYGNLCTATQSSLKGNGWVFFVCLFACFSMQKSTN